jgi:hypothetical protein
MMGCHRRPSRCCPSRRRPIASSSSSLAVAMKSRWGVVVVVLVVVVPSRHPRRPMLNCHEITMGCRCRPSQRRPSRHRPCRRPVVLVVVPSSSSSSLSSLAVAIVMPSKNDTLISPQPCFATDKMVRGKQAVSETRTRGREESRLCDEDEVHTKRCCF